MKQATHMPNHHPYRFTFHKTMCRHNTTITHNSNHFRTITSNHNTVNAHNSSHYKIITTNTNKMHPEWENTTQNPPKPCLTPKSHNTTPCQCPYSRPQQIKPSKPQPKPISGPPHTADICLNQLLMHLISLNGNPQSNTVSQNMSFQDPSTPTSPQTQSSSSSSSYTDPDSEPEATSSNICTAGTESLSGQSTASTCSDRQLRPRLSIHYNETFLTRLQGRPQVTVMPALSIPLPLSSSEEEDMDTTEPLWKCHHCITAAFIYSYLKPYILIHYKTMLNYIYFSIITRPLP